MNKKIDDRAPLALGLDEVLWLHLRNATTGRVAAQTEVLDLCWVFFAPVGVRGLVAELPAERLLVELAS